MVEETVISDINLQILVTVTIKLKWLDKKKKKHLKQRFYVLLKMECLKL